MRQRRRKPRVERGRGVGQRRLVAAGFVAGVWAVLPPFVGPALHTAMGVEIIDHLVPGAVALGVTALATRWSQRSSDAWFVGGLVVALAGTWQMASHVPLVVQAVRGAAPWIATASHVLPGIALLGLGAAWVAVHR